LQFRTSSAKGRLSSRSRGSIGKEDKYAEITKAYLFFLLTFETMVSINGAGQEFVTEQGQTPRKTHEKPASSFNAFLLHCSASLKSVFPIPFFFP
jgi:hypothetical protein